MSLINNLLNQNIKEDLYLEDYYDLKRIFYKYRNYLNFQKKVEKIEIENTKYISVTNKIMYINISNKLYDLLDKMYLYIEFNNIDKEYNINDLIETIELYIGDKSIEKIDGDILNLYLNIYKNQNNKKIYNIISKINENFMSIYIPIMFYFMLENKNLIPLYLLYFEDISLYIKFKSLEKTLIINNIYLLVNYIKLDYKYINTIKYQSDIELLNSITTNKLDFQILELIDSKDLDSTIDGTVYSNIFNINIKKFVTQIILKLEDIIIESIEIKINSNSLKYTSKELEFLTYLNTNFNLNNVENLYLLNFGIYKEKLSGFVNFNLINNLSLEIKVINTDNINLSFSEKQLKLILTRPHAASLTDSIELTRNIRYNIINTNNEVDIIVVKNLTTNELYEEFDNINKTFILRDNTPRLYFKNSINENSKEISIDVANINEGDYKYIAGKLKLYTIEYKKYDIYNGKLVGINEKEENYLIIKLKKILETIDNKKLEKVNYNIYKELKEKYKFLINKNNDDKIEDLLKEYIKNKNIKSELITNIKELIDDLEKMKKKIKKNSIKKIDNT